MATTEEALQTGTHRREELFEIIGGQRCNGTSFTKIKDLLVAPPYNLSRLQASQIVKEWNGIHESSSPAYSSQDVELDNPEPSPQAVSVSDVGFPEPNRHPRIPPKVEIELDSAFQGLAYLGPELTKRWRKGDIGELGFWRAKGRRNLRPGDKSAIKEFLRQGGEGRYYLEPEPLRMFFSKWDLDAERVTTDLWDRGILIGDPGHATKLVYIGRGKPRRRMFVLPDVYVRTRSPMALPSALRYSHGRKW